MDEKIKMRKCSSCGSYYEVGSISKRLFKMPSGQEWLTLIMIVLVILASFAYKRDIQVCRDFAANQSQLHYGPYNSSNVSLYYPPLNTTELNKLIINNNDTNNES